MSKTAQALSVLLAALLLGGGGYFLWQTGFFEALDSSEALEAYITRFSPYGQLVFFSVQLLSVILAPVPSNITALAGAMLFGLWPSFFLTFSAVLLGSLLVFGLARALGRPFVDKLVSRKLSEKYLHVIQSKQDVFLFLVFLFPLFPDDLICILAGLAGVAPLRFFIIALLARPWGLLAACAVGSAAISVPLWGMALLGAAGAVILVAGLKYGDKWEQAILEKLRRK